ncbi:hypothetical protein [Flavobacterium sp. RS13.1]|uniref:hypothetical protein n=1 Tax=Flavobacterium sp. RS13.1 TaxID=3400345 RepID=UPI003AACAE68
MENKKIADYIIVEFESKENLRLEVLNKIKEGYFPLGGVSMSVDSGELTVFKYFAQAMVKYAEK